MVYLVQTQQWQVSGSLSITVVNDDYKQKLDRNGVWQVMSHWLLNLGILQKLQG